MYGLLVGTFTKVVYICSLLPTAVTFADCCECIVILFKLKNAKIFSAQMQRITRTVANEYTLK